MVLRKTSRIFDVLIVDDSAPIRKILRHLLLESDLAIGKIVEAADGIEAVELLKTESVNVILTDVNMPRMDGLELVRHLRSTEEWKNVPVILVTTEGSEAAIVDVAKLGIAGYVRKPFSLEQVRDALLKL
jgi:two-component system, chemotaxis family, chemotaxis protein CheY